MNWVQDLFGALIAAVIATIAGAFLLPGLGRPDAIPPSTAQAILAREVTVAESLGFEVTESGSVDFDGYWMTLDDWPFEASLEAGECVALIITTEGDQRPTQLVLTDEEGSELAEDEGRSRCATHVQWCADHAQTVRSRVLFTEAFFMGHNRPGEARPFTLRFRELRARATDVGGRDGLNRGWIQREEPTAAPADEG